MARFSGRALAIMLVLIVAAGLPGLGSTAFAADNGGGYLNPFPKNDVYEVRVYGDYFAEGIAYGLDVLFKVDKRVKVAEKYRRIRAIVRTNFDATLNKHIKELTARPAPIAVIMSGGDDRASIRYPNGARIRLNSPTWRRSYAGRVDKLIKAFKAKGVAIYWVGLPILRNAKANRHARLVNDIVRERVYLNGAKFIDVYSAFVDEGGNYDRFGPDLSGKIRKLRSRDGETFTAAGNRKLAHFVVREIKRDMVQAKTARAVPLAGSAAEQRRINPAAANAAAAQKGWNSSVEVTPGARRKGPRKNARRKRYGPREQKSDNTKVSIKTVDSQGKVKTVTMTILRPAIPAAVIALVTRKQSANRAARIGDAVPGMLQGGLTILSSITPVRGANGTGRRRLPPTHTAYYRGLIKGEQLPSKPGRADDFRWPRAGSKEALRQQKQPSRAQAPVAGAVRPRS